MTAKAATFDKSGGTIEHKFMYANNKVDKNNAFPRFHVKFFHVRDVFINGDKLSLNYL